MQTHLEPDAPNTTNFLKYIVSELLSREPLKKGKVIVVSVSEDSPNFPEFTDNALEGDQSIKLDDRIQEMNKFSGTKMMDIFKYLVDKLKYHTAPQIPLLEGIEPLRFGIPLVVVHPNGLYEMADNLGILTQSTKAFSENDVNLKPEFKEDPPRISWQGKTINIPINSLEVSICRVAFTKKQGELISWDEIADEHDGSYAGKKKLGPRSIYDGLRRINARVSSEINQKLFKTSKLSSVRIT